MPEAIESVDYLSAGYGPNTGEQSVELSILIPGRLGLIAIMELVLDIFNGGLLVEGRLQRKAPFF